MSFRWTTLRKGALPERSSRSASRPDDQSEGWSSWLNFERDRLRVAWRDAALNHLAADRDPAEAIELSARLLEADPLQAQADAGYFVMHAGRTFSSAEEAAIHGLLLKAHRRQYIVTGVQEPRFADVMKALVTRRRRIGSARRLRRSWRTSPIDPAGPSAEQNYA